MANNETKPTVEVEFFSEHFLYKFGLEYIKHDILINEWSYKKREEIDTLKPKAIHNLARVLRIEANEKKITELCGKFCQEILLLLRQVVRRCLCIGWEMKVNWQLDFALLLMPPWLRTVERHLLMLPKAVVAERRAGQASKVALTCKLKAQLREGAAAAFARNSHKFEENDFKKVSAYYNITMIEALKVCRDMCAKARQRIVLEAQCGAGGREVDGELTDLLLLHDHTFSIVTPESLTQQKQLEKLTQLYQDVLKRDIENVLRNERPRLLEAWLLVAATYPFSLGFSSVVYIQRLWYELKQLARRQVLAYHRGRARAAPHPLLLSIVANFRHIVQEPLPTWRDYVKSKMVVNFKDISKSISRKVLEEVMDEEIENNSTNRLRHVCIVPPRHNSKRVSQGEPQCKENKHSEATINNKDINTISNTIDVAANKNEFTDNVNLSATDDLKNKQLLMPNNDVEHRRLDLDSVLNNIDPTKAHKSLIFDSDSDCDSGRGGAHCEVNKFQKNKHSCDKTRLTTHIPRKCTEKHDAKSPHEKNPANKMDKTIVNIDLKSMKEVTIPLVRCDQVGKEPCPSKHSIKRHSVKILPKQTRICSKSKAHVNVEGLPEAFVNNRKNKYLFKLCKPVTVPLPRAGKAEKATCARRKKVQLADIDEVRKINSTILTAEVAPVSINRCGPPAEATSFSVSSEESTKEISNLNIINALELDDLFKKLPVPPLNPITNTPVEINTLSTEHCNIDLEQNKTNKSNTDEKCRDDVDDKIVNIINNCPRSMACHHQSKSPAAVNTVESSDSNDDMKLSVVVDLIKKTKTKRPNEENKQKQLIKKRKRKSKRKPSIHECTQTASTNAFEEWARQKNMNKKYFQLPNINPKPSDEAICATKAPVKTGSNIIQIPNVANTPSPSHTNSSAHNSNRPPLVSSTPVIDLTHGPDDTPDHDVTPIITNVYSLASSQADRQNKLTIPSKVAPPIITQQTNVNSFNTDLATITKMPTLSSQIVQKTLPPVNTLVPVAGPQFYVQQPTQAQYTSEPTGRRFVIIPQSQLLNGCKQLLLPNLKIVNASLTSNPVGHIQKMMAPQIEPTTHPLLIPWVPLNMWVQGKSVEDLVILQIDASKPTWTLTGGQTIVTLTDYTCEAPIYCSLPAEFKTRILFPQENNGVDIYNPATLQIYEDAAKGTTPFANWVRSVLHDSGHCHDDDININNVIDEVGDDSGRPTPRIKVKSFARLPEGPGDFEAPSRVCLRDRMYMKISERPLRYAKVLTALRSLEEFQNLVSHAPLKILPKGTTTFESLQPIDVPPALTGLASARPPP